MVIVLWLLVTFFCSAIAALVAYRLRLPAGRADWLAGYRRGTIDAEASAGQVLAHRIALFGERIDHERLNADRAARVTHAALHRAREAERQASRPVACELAVDLSAPLDGEGYLYVVEFSTGVVKVGQTMDPRRRMAEHRRDADTFKVAIVNFWISSAHWNYLDNEIDLINRCMQVSTRARLEYFRDVTFDAAVGFANELAYYTEEGVSDEHVKH